MFNKLRTFLELTKNLSLEIAIKDTLSYLGIPIRSRIKYPITPLEITIDKAPLSFWTALEQKNGKSIK